MLEQFLTFYESCAFYSHRIAIVFRRGSVNTSVILCLRQTLAIQWNLDLKKSLETGQICPLNGGFVISKTSI